MHPRKSLRFKTYHSTRKTCYEDAAYEKELYECARERAASNGSGDVAPVPPRFCWCAELVVNGHRQAIPTHHDCGYITRRNSLIDEASRIATERCGDPTGDHECGHRWTQVFAQQMDYLSAKLLR